MKEPLVAKPKLRCAVYTRKSSEEGLELDSTASTPSEKHVRRMSRVKKRRAGIWCRTDTTTVASPAEHSNGLPCNGSCRTSRPGASTLSLSIKSIGEPLID